MLGRDLWVRPGEMSPWNRALPSRQTCMRGRELTDRGAWGSSHSRERQQQIANQDFRTQRGRRKGEPVMAPKPRVRGRARRAADKHFTVRTKEKRARVPFYSAHEDPTSVHL